MKRVITMIILAVFCCTLFPVQLKVDASEYRTATIQVESYDGLHAENVVLDQNNSVYVPLSWLTKYGLMDWKEDGQRYTFFNAGEEKDALFAKRIYIDKATMCVTYGCYVSNTKFYTAATYEFSNYYKEVKWPCVPLTELLPLINAKTEITAEGILHIYPNDVSVFSALYNTDIAELSFNASEDMVGSEFMKVAGLLVDTILDLRIDRLDGLYDTGEFRDYNELFQEYLADDSVYLSAFDNEKAPYQVFAEKRSEELKAVDDIVGFGGIGVKSFGYMLDSDLYPEFHVFKDTYSKLGNMAEGAYKVVKYYSTYLSQVEDHRKMLTAVYGGDYYYQANPACKAAKEIAAVYGAETFELQKTGVYKALRDYLVDEFNDTAVKEFGLTPYKIAFGAVKVILPGAVEEFGKSSQLAYMDEVVRDAQRVFLKRTKNLAFDETSLDDLRLTAMLALVASRHAYRTFWPEEEKAEKLHAISEALTLLYLSADSVACESLEYHEEKKKELLETQQRLLANVSETKPTNKEPEVDIQSVYAAYGALLRDGVWLSCDNGDLEAATHYQLLDMNGDGIPEIIVFAVDMGPPIPVFEIYTYSQNQVVKIADSLNTCDLSCWYNAGHSLCIQGETVVYEVAKGRVDYTAGTAGRLEYDGKTVNNVKLEIGEHLHNAAGEGSCELLVQNRDIIGGIEIGSSEDFLSIEDQKDNPCVDTWVTTIDYDGLITNEINLNRDGTVRILDYDGTYEEAAHVWNSAEGTWKLVKEKGNTYWIEMQLSHHDTSNMGDPYQQTEYTEYTIVITMQIDGDSATIQLDSGEFPYIFYDYSFTRGEGVFSHN